jgi:hypothetical protein
VIAVALALLFAVRALRRRRRPRLAPAHARALAGIAEIERAGGDELARLDVLVRDYLDERLGLHTRRQTVPEMITACADLPDEARRALAELASQTELAKYAAVEPGEADRRRALELARRVVESCATLPVGQETPRPENDETARPG